MPRRTRPRRSRSRRRPRPPHGQHFLADERVRRKILDWLGGRPEDCWLEIGAGHGEMTELLAETGGRVAAVESDPKLAEELRQAVGGSARVRVAEGDILEVSIEELARALETRRLRVYGNLPYYATSPILHRLYAAIETIADIHVVVQREVAERLAAPPGSRDYGYLSVVTQFHVTPDILWTVPRGAFRPPPQVESCLVQLVPPGKSVELNVEDPGAFLRFVGACFRQKRKTLANNLRSFYGVGRVQAAVAAVSLGKHIRAEQLPIETFALLYRVLDEGEKGAR